MLCAGHNGAQKQGAGGPVGSARTQLWTEPAQPRSIWALITSVEVRPRLPQVRRTMRALSKSFVVTFKALFSQNLKYFIRPPSLAPILQVYCEKPNCALPWNPFPWGSTKDSSKSVWVLMQSCCSSNTPMFKFQAVKKREINLLLSQLCVHISREYCEGMWMDLNQAATHTWCKDNICHLACICFLKYCLFNPWWIIKKSNLLISVNFLQFEIF